MSEPRTSSRICAICGKPQEDRFKPFCSKRCADVDLSRWLKGNYAIPTSDRDDQSPRTTGDEDD